MPYYHTIAPFPSPTYSYGAQQQSPQPTHQQQQPAPYDTSSAAYGYSYSYVESPTHQKQQQPQHQPYPTKQTHATKGDQSSTGVNYDFQNYCFSDDATPSYSTHLPPTAPPTMKTVNMCPSRSVVTTTPSTPSSSSSPASSPHPSASAGPSPASTAVMCCYHKRGQCNKSTACWYSHEGTATTPCHYGVKCVAGHADLSKVMMKKKNAQKPKKEQKEGGGQKKKQTPTPTRPPQPKPAGKNAPMTTLGPYGPEAMDGPCRFCEEKNGVQYVPFRNYTNHGPATLQYRIQCINCFGSWLADA